MIDFTGPQPALEDPEPLITHRRARHGDRSDHTPDEPEPGHRTAARRSREAEPEDAATTPRSWRRVGWRKGSDIDEEMWPAEAFGGVSDEQFWDDLAADKPLATTARSAQPDTGAKRRPPNAGPLPDLYPADDRGVAGRGGGRGGAAEGPGTDPQPRLRPDDRTAIQPVHTGTQPSPTSPVVTLPYPAATQPSPIPSQPSPIATQPTRAAYQPAESRGRSRVGRGADEDPLTSPAYSLRPRGSVGGRAYPSSRGSSDLNRQQHQAAGQVTQAFSPADAQAAGGGYPDGVPPFRQSDRPSLGANGRGRPDAYRSDTPRPDPLRPEPLRPEPGRAGDAYGGTGRNAAYLYPQQPYSEPTQSMSTSPYGERHGYENPAGARAQGAQGAQGSPGGDPGRASGAWSPGRVGGNAAGDGNWSSRPASPPVDGHRGAYDQRSYDRRLTGMP